MSTTADGNQICNFLGHKRLAVIGVSRNSKDFSRVLFHEFLKRGYDAIPVHPDLPRDGWQALFSSAARHLSTNRHGLADDFARGYRPGGEGLRGGRY